MLKQLTINNTIHVVECELPQLFYNYFIQFIIVSQQYHLWQELLPAKTEMSK